MYKIKYLKVFKNIYLYNNCILYTANTQYASNYLTFAILVIESKLKHAHIEHLIFITFYHTIIRNISKAILNRQNAPQSIPVTYTIHCYIK